MKKPSKKPTTKEIVLKIYDLEVGLNQLHGMITHMQGVFDNYLNMKKDIDKFNKYMKKKMEEYENDKTGKQPGGIEVVKK
tara:strand:+ start:339 stop:578 length:240 start_codon:yes stop_codon:yes gene_type:complete